LPSLFAPGGLGLIVEKRERENFFRRKRIKAIMETAKVT
jgi:vacuolar-type H+-ATPase subunit D/Vma8